MRIEDWGAYATVVLLLVSAPGPSQLLMMSNSLANGVRRSLATALGDLTANLLQILAASLGLGALIAASESAFLAIKWCGVAYLAILGIGKIVSAGRSGPTAATRGSLRSLWIRGFVTSAANPKAVLFFAALFPQFIDPQGPLWMQVALLGATYLALDGACLTLYGSASSWIVRRMGRAAVAWTECLSGGLMIAAGLALALKPVAR